jgi:NtrC-family two-component system response regulator AlgB
MEGPMKLLVVDDEPSLRRTVRITLESLGHTVAEAPSGRAALTLASRERFDLAFLDLRLGRETGLDVLQALREAAPDLGVVLMTAYASIETAVEALRRGAFDYLPKPFTPDQLRVVLDRFQLVRGLQQQVEELRGRVEAAGPEIDLESRDPATQAVLEMAERVAASEATVLLRGENGTGKGVLARVIHERSPRARRPLVTVHCPSLSGELLESELFGHVRGAFTGAVQDREGKVASAEGGTLFLDEVGDLPLTIQPKLLRFLQERTYERVGENNLRTGNVRLLAATNHNLETEVAAGRFREDLLYRLNVIEITLPPLRERRGDILPLAERLLAFFGKQAGRPNVRFTAEARQALERHRWPGNVRELRNVVERAVILSRDDDVGLSLLPGTLGASTDTMAVGGNVTLEAIEIEHIRRVLARAGSLDEAATILGIDPSTLYRKRMKYGL